jgi:hypothetical protein
MTVPIFVISFNRLEVLRRSIASYRQLGDIEVVIHDSGSSHLPLLEYLEALERQDVTVYRNRSNIEDGDDLNSVNETVQHWLENHPEARNYVVTDPDIELEDGCSDLLSFYRYVLDNFSDVDVVGPMLRIDDIPDFYPLKEKVIRGHTAQFWHKEPLYMTWGAAAVAYQHAPIDTSFGMYRRTQPFQRLLHGIRTYEPFWAKHLDWYIDPSNMTDDQKVYLQTASKVSHWGGGWLKTKLEEGLDPDYHS